MTDNTEEYRYKKQHLTEYVKCLKDPVYFIKNYFYIQHPSKGAIKLQLHPYQEELIHNYEDNRFTIVLPARQVGTTTVSTAYLLWFNMFHSDKTTLAAADTSANAKELIFRIRFAYDALPQWFQSLSKLTENNKFNLGFDNGSRIVGTSVNASAGCGMSISLLYVDQFAFSKSALQYEFWTSNYPTLIIGHGKCIISSSPNKDDDTFAKLWSAANEGTGNKFYPVRVEWSAPPGRDENFKQDMINCIGEKRWRQEYECEFLVDS